jgi:UDP-N-acetylmuramoylalanine--D-glutamate ligase
VIRPHHETYSMDVWNKTVVVVGLARSGTAAARLLISRGARVIGNDSRGESELPEAEQLRALGAELRLGGHDEGLFAAADLVVLSPGVPADLPALDSARAAGVEIISEPELAGRFLRGRMIGVTGSNGKTTTTTLIGELMKAAGANVIVGGNIGTPLTSLVEKSNDSTWTVAELSSFQLEMIDTLRVHVAVVTNITPDHLDRHGTFENYVKAKQRIFSNQTDQDWAVLNGRDETVARMASIDDFKAKAVYFSSRGVETIAKTRADIFVRQDRLRTTMLSADRSESDVMSIDDIPLRGMHNVENVMAALAATFCAMDTRGENLQTLCDAIISFKGVEHRIEFVTEIDGVKFYNDSKATNVDSTAKALEAFDRNVVLILGGKDKGSDYASLTELIRERVKHIILIGAAADKIAGQLSTSAPMTRADSMRDAVETAMDIALPGDTVLLAPACASFDMFDNYEHRGQVFKAAVMEMKEQRNGARG